MTSLLQSDPAGIYLHHQRVNAEEMIYLTEVIAGIGGAVIIVAIHPDMTDTVQTAGSK